MFTSDWTRPPSASYQFRKFARRNRALVVGVVAVFAVLVAGVAVSTWQASRAMRSDQEACRMRVPSANIPGLADDKTGAEYLAKFVGDNSLGLGVRWRAEDPDEDSFSTTFRK